MRPGDGTQHLTRLGPRAPGELGRPLGSQPPTGSHTTPSAGSVSGFRGSTADPLTHAAAFLFTAK